MKNWYKIRAMGDRAEVMLYDEIGLYGITARDFVRDLKSIEASAIDLRINSPGGAVFDGMAIHNALRAHPAQVQTHVDGVAASIASIIALAGDTVTMAGNAFLMIHWPWTVAMGNSAELRKAAEDLDKIGEAMLDIYLRKTKKKREEMMEMLDAETWLSASEALEMGMADEVEDEHLPAAAFALPAGASIPQALQRIRQNADARAVMERRLRLAAM